MKPVERSVALLLKCCSATALHSNRIIPSLSLRSAPRPLSLSLDVSSASVAFPFFCFCNYFTQIVSLKRATTLRTLPVSVFACLRLLFLLSLAKDLFFFLLNYVFETLPLGWKGGGTLDASRPCTCMYIYMPDERVLCVCCGPSHPPPQKKKENVDFGALVCRASLT